MLRNRFKEKLKGNLQLQSDRITLSRRSALVRVARTSNVSIAFRMLQLILYLLFDFSGVFVLVKRLENGM